MAYAFDIIRKPVDKLPNGLLVTKMTDDGTVVYSGSIEVANEKTAHVVRNHLAMRSHAKYNGDVVTDKRTYNYWVSWRKTPRGKHRKLFLALNRYSWL